MTRANDIETKAKAKLQRAAATRDLLPAPTTEPLHYEIHIDTSNAALARFAAALIATPCALSPRKLRLRGELGRGITQVLMVSFPDVDAAERFRERCKPQDMFRAKVATLGGGMRTQCPTKENQ